MKPATSPPHGAADSRSPVRRSIQRRDFAVTPCTPIPCAESALIRAWPAFATVQNPRSSYTLQALKRSSGISPRSWRAHHGAADFKQAVDLASRFNGSDEAVRAYLDWLSVVARDEIAALWPHVEKVAHALVARQTLTA